MPYSDYQPFLGPTWLQHPFGAAWLKAFGHVKDFLVDRSRQAIKARFPLVSPSDGLTALGLERGIDRAAGESDATYAQRVAGAWTTWSYAGTPTGVLNAFWDAGYTNVYLATAKGQGYTLDGSRSLVTTQGDPLTFAPSFWNVFSVFFLTPLPPSWVSGGIPASNSSEANNIRRLITKWKPGHAICYQIVIEQSGAIWGVPVTQKWGDPGLVWGGVTTVWTP